MAIKIKLTNLPNQSFKALGLTFEIKWNNISNKWILSCGPEFGELQKLNMAITNGVNILATMPNYTYVAIYDNETNKLEDPLRDNLDKGHLYIGTINEL